MASAATTVLAVADSEGNYYAIPVAALAQFRASEEQKATIEKHLGAEVQGYVLNASVATGKVAHSAAAAVDGDISRFAQGSADSPSIVTALLI